MAQIQSLGQGAYSWPLNPPPLHPKEEGRGEIMESPPKGPQAQRVRICTGLGVPLSPLDALSKGLFCGLRAGSRHLARGTGTLMPSVQRAVPKPDSCPTRKGRAGGGGKYSPFWAKVRPSFLPHLPKSRDTGIL